MKRFFIVGLTVVVILGIAVTMALINNTAMADSAQVENERAAAVIDGGENKETAVTQDPIANPAAPNFVDEDGDGVCDVCGHVPGTGAGNQNGNGASNSNFVDLDGDGVCDDCTPLAPADGTGNQYGRQGGKNGQGQGNRNGRSHNQP